jgi:TPP-dependent pyruvate/acetoin dehydrogenase alpha subunit
VGDDWDAGYRARAAMERWQAGDPLCTDVALAARLAPAIHAEITAAEAFAEASPWPGREALLADVA